MKTLTNYISLIRLYFTQQCQKCFFEVTIEGEGGGKGNSTAFFKYPYLLHPTTDMVPPKNDGY